MNININKSLKLAMIVFFALGGLIIFTFLMAITNNINDVLSLGKYGTMYGLPLCGATCLYCANRIKRRLILSVWQ